MGKKRKPPIKRIWTLLPELFVEVGYLLHNGLLYRTGGPKKDHAGDIAIFEIPLELVTDRQETLDALAKIHGHKSKHRLVWDRGNNYGY